MDDPPPRVAQTLEKERNRLEEFNATKRREVQEGKQSPPVLMNPEEIIKLLALQKPLEKESLLAKPLLIEPHRKRRQKSKDKDKSRKV